ncbi:hypothetical protein FISHEDRAFT_34818 [Fistulina hepatica ATCC 64428]|uniref:Uncharacterized protein n=1 Tax=Fistulina hepatica ATCC 64428 TaxID=1128425 RepID=A0A0D7AME6_9AGAR|nr:hypothetical protein FISHEDRAFT_34818 [Fistulina hepatica ATCC 64428]
MDFIQNLDPARLAQAGTLLSFIVSVSSSPPYNFPLFLFGMYAQENSDAIVSLQAFTGLLIVSILYDFVWMMTNGQHGLARFLSIILLLLKIPTSLSFVYALRRRGNGLGLHGNDMAGATVWSMPGGFTSSGREGYQTVDEPQSVAKPPEPQAAAPRNYQDV